MLFFYLQSSAQALEDNSSGSIVVTKPSANSINDTDSHPIGKIMIDLIFNRPGVAGSVLQSPLSLIHSVCHDFLKYLKDTVYPKLNELGSKIFERMFTPHHVSHVLCDMSHVKCNFFF